MSRINAAAALGLALLLLTVSNLAAADKPTDQGKPPRPATAAVEKALDSPFEAKFDKTPLREVVKLLENRCKIHIALDQHALNDVKIGADTPVTIDIHAPSLRLGLHELLSPLGLTWTVRDGALLITTPEEEDYLLFVKVLDVSDLVVCRDDKGILWDDYDTLTDAIRWTVAPTTWDEVGGPASIIGASLGKAKILIISQTYRNHRKIAELLSPDPRNCRETFGR